MTRNTGNGNLVNAGETWPLLYRDKNRLYDGAYPAGVTYPIAIQANRANNLTGFAPDVEIGHARTWTIGFQRSLTRDMAVDIRYVGTRGVDQWSTLNYNARDVETNGFINEFRAAVANLKANNQSGAANRVGSFGYFGPGTDTNPLPVYHGVSHRAVGQCGRVPVYRHGLDEHRDHAGHGVQQPEPDQLGGGSRRRAGAACQRHRGRASRRTTSC